MTGQQENPGTGMTVQGEITEQVNIEALVRTLGFENVRTINPNNLKEVKETLNWAVGT